MNALDARRDVGREVVYVDLAADPPINAENPPDLKVHADSAAPFLNGSAEDANSATAKQQKSAAAQSEPKQKAKPAKAKAAAAARLDDVDAITKNIMAKVS